MTRARDIREQSGMTAEDAAKRLRVTPAYLLACERSGFPYPLAMRAARVYGCPIDFFLARAGNGAIYAAGRGPQHSPTNKNRRPVARGGGS